MRIADETVGQAADVHQAAVVHADIDETAEIDHVEHRAGQFHAGGQVFQLQHALLEDRRRQVLARVAAGTGQLRENSRSVSVPTAGSFTGAARDWTRIGGNVADEFTESAFRRRRREPERAT